MPEETRELIPLAEARRFMLDGLTLLAPRRTLLRDAAGLVLAEQVTAVGPVPPFANSAMDGYAVIASDTASTPAPAGLPVSGVSAPGIAATPASPARLSVAGVVAAGDSPPASLAPGTAVRIMTGAPLPPGADAVVMQEHVTLADAGETVVIETPVRPGENVRHPGEDIAAGAVVFDQGAELGPAHIGVLASLGIDAVLARPRPVVGVLSTGNELAKPGARLTPGKIRDANRPALLARLAADGFKAIDLGICGDDPDELADLLKGYVIDCDAIVATGGVSVGDHDVLKVVLEKLGGWTARSMQVAIKPGQHVAFALLDGDRVPAFGLPGNPVAALVTYELYVRPALRAMSGCRQLDRPRLTAIADQDLKRRPGPKLHLVRVTARTAPDGTLRIRPAHGQQSHQLHAMAGANALALLPDGPGAQAGDPVEILILDPNTLA
jgi:molybdenum cofactor synthesis domain-containing protein